MNFIEYGQLYIELIENGGIENLEILAINKLKIIEEVDQHGKAEIEILLHNKESRYGIDLINEIDTTKNVRIVNKNKEDESLYLLFVGLINEINLCNNAKEIKIKIKLYSTSINLDIKKRSRSFQDINNSYKNLFEEIVLENEAQVSDTLSKGIVQDNFIIQYDETNWEFLKRCVSKLKGNVVVNNISDKPYVHIGVLSGETTALESEDYKQTWDGESFLKCEMNYGDFKYHDKFSYDIVSVHNFRLMDNIYFKEYTFKIFKKVISYENGIVKFIYNVMHEPAFKTIRVDYKEIVGLKIYGKVISVKPDRVRVHLDIDENQEVEKAYWFKMSTPYPENTGFYVMPEVGSNVMLLIPNKVAEEAFIEYIGRLDGTTNPKTQNPNSKYFGNTTGKEMRLSPGDMQFTERALHNVMNLKTNKGITIITSADAKIVMNKGTFNGKKIKIKSNGEVVAATPGASIWVRDGKIDIKALMNIEYN